MAMPSLKHSKKEIGFCAAIYWWKKRTIQPTIAASPSLVPIPAVPANFYSTAAITPEAQHSCCFLLLLPNIPLCPLEAFVQWDFLMSQMSPRRCSCSEMSLHPLEAIHTLRSCEMSVCPLTVLGIYRNLTVLTVLGTEGHMTRMDI